MNIFEYPEVANLSSSKSSPLVICLSNCREDSVISLDHVLEKIQQLEHSLSFKKVHGQFASGEFAAVVDKLLPLLDEDAESAAMSEVYLCG